MESCKYDFYVNGHLGNNRVVADALGAAIQKNHYYPFGMSFAESTDQAKQPYKYNGKEFDTNAGLNLYDYHARQYEPAIGRFTTIDPLAEKYYSISPYAYVGNNPIRRTDPTGMKWADTRVPEEIIKQTSAIIKELNSEVNNLIGELGLMLSTHKEYDKKIAKLRDARARISLLEGVITAVNLLDGDQERIFSISKDIASGENLFVSQGTGKDKTIYIHDYRGSGINHRGSIHEITHVAQALGRLKGLEFDNTGSMINNATGDRMKVRDEIEAFRTEAAYSGKLEDRSIDSLSDINLESLGIIMKRKNPGLFDSINKIIKYLQSPDGLGRTEDVYFGW